MIDVEKMTPNRSKTYLFPLISEFCAFPDNIVYNLKNTYLFDKDNLHKECIYLLFKYDIKNPEFTKFEQQLNQTKGFETHYDLKNNLILFVIKFPVGYLPEYYAFKEGKYSEYGADAQKLIIKYLGIRRIPAKIIEKVKKVFKKDPELREEMEARLRVTIPSNCELGEMINEDEETIDINKNILNYYESKI